MWVLLSTLGVLCAAAAPALTAGGPATTGPGGCVCGGPGGGVVICGGGTGGACCVSGCDVRCCANGCAGRLAAGSLCVAAGLGPAGRPGLGALVCATARGPLLLAASGTDRPSCTEQPKAWLGVRVSPVPAALKAHIGRGGLMIANIVKDSPADEAGLERYDVIVSLAGKPVEDMDGLLKAVDEAGPGKSLELAVLRAGQQTKLTISPAERPQQADWEYKYEEGEDTVLDHEFIFRGHRLRRGPQGWVFEPLGRLKDLPEVVKRFRWFGWGLGDDEDLLAPFADEDFMSGLAPEGAEVEIRIEIERDGKVLSVHRLKDGSVKVERREAGGERSLKTYGDVRELKKRDPEAYRLLRGRGPAGGRALRWFLRRPALKELPKLRDRFQKEIRLKLKDAQQRAEVALKDAERDAEQAGRSMRILSRALGKQAADVDVNVHDDGSISVVVRKGGTRVTYEFRNKEEFKQREPELYRKFREALE